MPSKTVPDVIQPISDEDDEIAKTWKKVQDRVRQMAGEKGVKLKYKDDLDIGGVQKYFADAQLHAAEKESTSLGKTKVVFDHTLSCIQALGEIAAGGAAFVVGGPANICYNALAFVIKAYKTYNGILESLADLLGRCLDFFDRFINYTKTAMSANLKHIACEQLKLFIEVCDHTLKLRHNKISRILETAKIVFLSDDGVKELLEKMKILNEKEFGLVISQTLLVVHNVEIGVSNVQKGVDGLATDVGLFLEQQNEDRSEQKTEKDTKKWKATLLRTLGWPESDLADSVDGKVPKRVWETRWRHYMEQVVERTGEWIERNSNFREWAYGTSHDLPVLGIEGTDGSGKTHLAAKIIKDLQQPPGASTRSAVAYYFMETDSKAKSASKNEVAAAVRRSLIWQYADAYPPFLKLAASICDKERAIGAPREMWKSFLCNEERYCMDMTFFIIIDGLSEDAHVTFLRPLLMLLKDNPQVCKRTRILITGSSNYFKLLGNAIDISLKIIKLGDKNLSDIERFIERRMDDIDMLQDRSQSDMTQVSVENSITQMRRKIKDKLKNLDGGNYRKIDLVLAEIAREDDEAGINSCLKRAGNAAADQIGTIIQTLNENSTPSDISDINEMVLWIINGTTWLKPLQMDAALLLKASISTTPASGNSPQPPYTHTAIFKSLESKMRDGRYSLFELVEGFNGVEVKFKDNTSIDDAKKRIPHKRRNTGDDDGHRDSVTIRPSEVRMVKHYLKTVCPDDIYGKFGFTEFFEQKLVRKNFICRDPNNAELTLALRCLTCLVEKRTRTTEALHSYAADSLYNHLYSAEYEYDSQFEAKKDGCLSLADRNLRAQIGTLLVRLFSEDYAVDSLFGIGCPSDDKEGQSALSHGLIPTSWYNWVTNKEGLDLLTRYFKDRAILENIRDKDLVKTFNAADGNKSLSLLKSASKTAVKHLLREDATSREVENAFLFLLAVQAKSQNKDIASHEGQSMYLWNPTVEHVNAVESWSLNLASVKEPTSAWEAHIASVLHRYSFGKNKHITKKDAETRARKALSMDPSNWQSSYTLARVVESDAEAATLLVGIISRLSEDKPILAEIFLELGDKYWNMAGLPEQAKAINAYSTSVGKDKSHYRRYLNIIQHYAERGLWGEIASLIDLLLKDPPKGHATAIGKMVAVNYATFSNSLRQTAKALDRWDLVRSVYDKGLKETAAYWPLCWIRYYYGNVLTSDTKHQDDGLKVWEDILKQEAPNNLGRARRYILDLMAAKLMPIYMKRALATKNTEFKHLDATSAPPAVPDSTTAEKINFLYETCQSSVGSSNVLYFSRYFFLLGDLQRAKASAKESVVQSLEMMSNDDPSDDHDCFWQLQTVFSTFGDIDNAKAAWNMMAVARKAEHDDYLETKRQWEAKMARREIHINMKGSSSSQPDVAQKASEDEGHGKAETEAVAERSRDDEVASDAVGAVVINESTNTSAAVAAIELYTIEGEDQHEMPQEPQEPNGKIGVYCDGCGHEWVYPSAIWTCMDDCGQVQFDEECYKKLKAGTLENNVCDKDHKFFYIPEQTVEEVTNVEKGHVIVRGEKLSLEDWKRKITAVYINYEKQLAVTAA